MTGSWLALALVSLTGSASFAGIAILVASRAQNSETVSGLMNLVMLPMFVLSGVFFSSAHFPGVHAAGDQRAAADRAVQRPARRDRRRRRASPGIAGSLAVMAVWGAISFVVGLRVFRWG